MEQEIYQWQMTGLNEAFELRKGNFSTLQAGEVIVKIAGCGVCHTDISFWHHGVKTKHALPLTLGHEISGTVVAGEKEWINQAVIIPAVLPCGKCELCQQGRSNICRHQLMPGNDFHGGFASHIKVPSQYLCKVPEKVLQKYRLEELAVIADAISTPYQVIEKSQIKQGDVAIIIGVGGVGIYGAMLAQIKGAKVIALDIKEEKLDKAKQAGVAHTLCIHQLDAKEIKAKIKEIIQRENLAPYAWKIFEFSGTKAGQDLAFQLITYASTLSVVGFTMDKLEIRLSNLMAFDATIIGTWGCKPELYNDVMDLIAEDKLPLQDLVQTFPMSQINEIFQNTLAHQYIKRSVLVPDFK